MEQYIDKSTVVAEIERRIEAHKETLKNCDSSISEMVLKGSMSAYQSLLYFFETLKVKEVNLDRTIDKWIDDAPITHEDCSITDVISTAKHFFKLGIKSKGE